MFDPEKEIKSIEQEHRKNLQTRDAKAKRVFNFLESEVENIIEDILDGLPFREICKKYDVTLSQFMSWRVNTPHSKSVDMSLTMSAESHIAKAEEILYKYEGSESVAAVSAAKNIAEHHRFVAGARDRKTFGLQKDVKIDMTERRQMSMEQMAELTNKINEAVEKKQLIEGAQEVEFTDVS